MNYRKTFGLGLLFSFSIVPRSLRGKLEIAESISKLGFCFLLDVIRDFLVSDKFSCLYMVGKPTVDIFKAYESCNSLIFILGFIMTGLISGCLLGS